MVNRVLLGPEGSFLDFWANCLMGAVGPYRSGGHIVLQIWVHAGRLIPAGHAAPGSGRRSPVRPDADCRYFQSAGFLAAISAGMPSSTDGKGPGRFDFKRVASRAPRPPGP